MKELNRFGTSNPEPPVKTKIGCRGVVAKKGKILVTHELNTGYYLIPGGALENGETLEECCVREVLEETGYTVKPINCFLKINEQYGDRLYVSYYFECDELQRGEQQLTPEEVTQGLVPEWIEIDKLSEIYSEYPNYIDSNRDKYRSYLREKDALDEYIVLRKTRA